MRRLVLLLLLPFYLGALEIEAEYKVTYGILGKLGKAKTKVYRDDKKYRITAHAYTKGMAKFFSNNRQEFYESVGQVKDGILVPLIYKKTKSTNRYVKEKKYVFNHATKTVTLFREEIYHDGSKKNSSSKEQFSYYAKNDILSLYFNLQNLVEGKDDKPHLEFRAVGSKEKNGRIDVFRLSGEDLKGIKKHMKLTDNTFLKVVINQKIFSSKKGEMFVNITPNNICNKAVLKDVLLFGDIVATKTSQKVTN